MGRYPLIVFKLKNVRGFVGMGLDFRSNALDLGPEFLKHLLATALLRVRWIQYLEPTLWLDGIRRELLFANDAIQVLIADGLEWVYTLSLDMLRIQQTGSAL